MHTAAWTERNMTTAAYAGRNMGTEAWAARLERPLTQTEYGILYPLLPPERRKRLDRVRNLSVHREPLCAYALLLCILFRRYGWTSFPKMAYSEHGKPYFPEFPSVYFSLSHTSGAVFAAVSDKPVGVDIERIRPVGKRVMRRILQPLSDTGAGTANTDDMDGPETGSSETGNTDGSPEMDHTEQLKIFFRRWVYLEACGKRDGIGITGMLSEKRNFFLSDRWNLTESVTEYRYFEPFPGYAAGISY